MPRMLYSLLPSFALLLALTACQPEPTPEDVSGEEEAVLVVQDFPTAGTVTAPDGVGIAYSQQGSGEPALVFIHGWSCDRTYWRHQLEPFARSHRVVSVDLAGHGDSGRQRSPWSFQAFGADVRAVVEELGIERVILVGHSMGGPVALEAASQLSGRVLGVVGVDTLHDADSKFEPTQWQEILAAYRQDFDGTCDRFVRSMFLEGADPEQVTDVVQDMCAAPPEIAISLLSLFPDYDMKAALASAGVPVHSINAASIPTNVEGNRRFAQGFDATVMDGVGHFLMMERPEAFNTELQGVIEGFRNPSASPRPGDAAATAET